MPEYPIVVRRWFSSGNGFSFHPDITERQLSEIAKLTHEYRLTDPVISKAMLGGLRLVGELVPETEILDPAVVGREPDVARMMLVDEGYSDEAEVLATLRRIQVPRNPGPDASLIAWVGPQREPPAPERVSDGGFLIESLGLTVLVGLLLVSMMTTGGQSGLLWGLLAGSVMLMLGHWTLNRPVSHAAVCFYENEIAKREKGIWSPSLAVQDGHTKLLLFGNIQGDVIRSRTEAGDLPHQIHSTNFRLGDAEYYQISASQSGWWAYGRESLLFSSGAKHEAVFVRQFVRKWRRWVLRYAIWIIE